VGFIARVLSFTKTKNGDTPVYDVKVDPGGGSNMTPEHYSSPGDDSQPLPKDTAAVLPIEGTGTGAAVGYIDPKNLQKAKAGEKRIYARDEDGNELGSLWLKDNGECVLNEGTDYAVKFNELKTAFDEFVSDFNGHSHSYIAPLHPAVPPAATTTGNPSTAANMASSKVELVRV